MSRCLYTSPWNPHSQCKCDAMEGGGLRLCFKHMAQYLANRKRVREQMVEDMRTLDIEIDRLERILEV